MARRRFLSLGVLAATLVATAVRAEPVTYVLDPRATQVHFEVRHFGTSTHRGRFDQVRGSATLDLGGAGGNVSVVIDTASVDTGDRVLDGMVRGNGFLASAAHPQAWFVASAMRFEGDRLLEVRGELTLRGVSQPLSLVATRYACRRDNTGRSVCGGDFEGTIKRSDFGAGFGLPFVGDDVRLLVAVQGIRAP